MKQIKYNIMKTFSIYESPVMEVMTFDSEGVLCGSTGGSLDSSHDGYTDGGSIDI